MTDHAIVWTLAIFSAILTAALVAAATRVRLLPEVIDVSIIPTGSGVLSLMFVSYGGLRRFHPDRIARLSLLGTSLGGVVTAAALLIALAVDVL